jgi:predicted transposase YbfD/YdcC
MGRQTKIANQIIEQGGEYALAPKDNQGNLYEEVKATFALAEKERFVCIQQESDQTVLQRSWSSGNQEVLDDQSSSHSGVS